MKYACHVVRVLDAGLSGSSSLGLLSLLLSSTLYSMFWYLHLILLDMGVCWASWAETVERDVSHSIYCTAASALYLPIHLPSLL